MKERTSFTLSHECKRLMRSLSEKLGISQAAVIEMAVRKLAEAENTSKGVSNGKTEQAGSATQAE